MLKVVEELQQTKVQLLKDGVCKTGLLTSENTGFKGDMVIKGSGVFHTPTYVYA